MDIRIKDKWRCKNGDIATIDYESSTSNYMWCGTIRGDRYSWDANGRLYHNDTSDYDLLELYDRASVADNRSSLELFRSVLGGKPVYHEFET